MKEVVNKSYWFNILGQVGDLFFPKRCVSCGKYGLLLCLPCAQKIEYLVTSTCPSCGRITEGSKFCHICRRKPGIYLDGIVIASRYNIGPIKELIAAFKYNGIIELSSILSEIIICKLKNFQFAKDSVFTFVPLYPRKQLKRGFNQSELIARNVSKHFLVSSISTLERTRNTPPQAKINKSARQTNLANAFQINSKLSDACMGRTVYLFDDVTTTHATLNECAKVLRQSGAKKVFGIVVAKNV